MTTVYECHNKACTLGNMKQPGRFTGGISAEYATALTGDPNAASGEGICPNCGQPGTKTDETHKSYKGKDPYQDIHDEIAARVADFEDDITKYNSQAELERLVAEREGEDA